MSNSVNQTTRVLREPKTTKETNKIKTSGEALLFHAVENSGNIAFSMSFHQGFPAKILAGSSPLGAA